MCLYCNSLNDLTGVLHLLYLCYRSVLQTPLCDAQLRISPQLLGSVWRRALSDSRCKLWRPHGEAEKSFPERQGTQGGVPGFKVSLLWFSDQSWHSHHELQCQRDLSGGAYTHRLVLLVKQEVSFPRCVCFNSPCVSFRWSTVPVWFQGTAGTSWRSSCSPFSATTSPNFQLCLLPNPRVFLLRRTASTPWVST